MEDLEVFGRSNPPCSACESLKTTLESKGVEFVYKDISDPVIFTEFSKHRLRSVPAVFEGSVFIGGLDEVLTKLKGE